MKKRCYFDLDRTLYDTDGMMEGIRTDLVGLGSSLADVDRVRDELGVEGYSFEGHLLRLGFAPDVVERKAAEYRSLQRAGDRYLYADVERGMDRLRGVCECHLLTYGFPEYQRHKFHGIQVLQPHFAATHYVWRGQTKGDIVCAERQDGREDWVLDDSVPQLEDIAAKAPRARLVRMCRPGTVPHDHPDDGVRWRVVRDLASFAQLLEAL